MASGTSAELQFLSAFTAEPRSPEREGAATVAGGGASLAQAPGGEARTTTVEALLGLLSLGAMSGYELRALIEESIGNFWSESFGQIYPALKRMLEDELAVVEERGGDGRPARKVYSLTDKGRDRLLGWIGSPARGQVPRNELLLKLFFGFERGPEVMARQLREFLAEQGKLAAHYSAVLENINGKRAGHPGTPYWRLTAMYGLRQVEALQVWAREALAEMERLRLEGAAEPSVSAAEA